MEIRLSLEPKRNLRRLASTAHLLAISDSVVDCEKQ